MVMVMLTLFYHDPSLILIMIANFEKIKIHQVSYFGFLLGIFSGGQDLLLFYCFQTKFQGEAKVLRGGKLPQGDTPLWKKASIKF